MTKAQKIDIIKVKVEIPVTESHRRYIAKAFGFTDDRLANVEQIREYVVLSYLKLMAAWKMMEMQANEFLKTQNSNENVSEQLDTPPAS